MPDGTPGVAGNVLLLLAEDSLEKTIIQRLRGAGANLENISTFRDQIILPDHLGRLESAIAQTRSRLVIIDPLMAFLSCDANGDQKVRRALGPLKRIADQANCAVIMVRHLTKRGGGNSLYRGSGSIGVVAATRSAFLIGKAPNDPDFRALCHTKCNLAPLAPSLLFEPVTVDNSVVVEWRGECDVSAEDVLKPNANESKLCHAMCFLTELLADGPVQQKVIRQQSIPRRHRPAKRLSGPKKCLASSLIGTGLAPAARSSGACPPTTRHCPPTTRMWRTMSLRLFKCLTLSGLDSEFVHHRHFRPERSLIVRWLLRAQEVCEAKTEGSVRVHFGSDNGKRSNAEHCDNVD